MYSMDSSDDEVAKKGDDKDKKQSRNSSSDSSSERKKQITIPKKPVDRPSATQRVIKKPERSPDSEPENPKIIKNEPQKPKTVKAAVKRKTSTSSEKEKQKPKDHKNKDSDAAPKAKTVRRKQSESSDEEPKRVQEKPKTMKKPVKSDSSDDDPKKKATDLKSTSKKPEPTKKDLSISESDSENESEKKPQKVEPKVSVKKKISSDSSDDNMKKKNNKPAKQEKQEPEEIEVIEPKLKNAKKKKPKEELGSLDGLELSDDDDFAVKKTSNKKEAKDEGKKNDDEKQKKKRKSSDSSDNLDNLDLDTKRKPTASKGHDNEKGNDKKAKKMDSEESENETSHQTVYKKQLESDEDDNVKRLGKKREESIDSEEEIERINESKKKKIIEISEQCNKRYRITKNQYVTTITSYNNLIKKKISPPGDVKHGIEDLRSKVDMMNEKFVEIKEFVADLNNDKDIGSTLNQINQLKASINELSLNFQYSFEEVNKKIDMTHEGYCLNVIKVLEKKGQQMDMVILIDGTQSMEPYLAKVRESISGVLKGVTESFQDAKYRVSVIIYRENTDNPVCLFLDFTSDIAKVEDFISKVKTESNRSVPEEVYAGFNMAVNLKWESAVRLITHIGDAPCHGKVFHDLGYDYHEDKNVDFYESWKKAFAQLLEKNINYMFLKISDKTNKMIQEFRRIFEDQKLVKNDCISEFYDCKMEQYQQATQAIMKESFQRTLTTKLQGIIQDKDFDKMATIEEEKEDPDLNSKKITLLDQILKPEESAIRIEAVGQATFYTTVTDLKSFNPKNPPASLKNKLELTIAQKPFSKGAFNLAYMASTKVENQNNAEFKVVVKKPKQKKREAYFTQAIIKNSLAAFFANEFNKRLKELKLPMEKRLYVTRIIYVRIGGESFLLEAFIPGEFEKFTNNYAHVNEFVPILTSFSHFSYQLSNGEYMIADLQGVNNLLTDPVIHSKSEDFADQGDIGKEGMMAFFRRHKCNDFCKMLELPTHPGSDGAMNPIINEVKFDDSKVYIKCMYFYCNENAKEENQLCESCKIKGIDMNKLVA